MATPSLAMIPSGYKASKVYSVLPESGVGDFDFTRATTATRVNSSGLIEEMAINVPRLEYPLIDGVVNGCPSLKLEPQRTNLIQYSEDFSQSVWNTWQSTKTLSNNINPKGTNGYYEISHTGSSSDNPNTRLTNVSLNGSYTLSFFIKINQSRYISLSIEDYNGDRARVYFDTTNKTFTTITNVGSPITNTSYSEFSNGWIRISLSVNLLNAVYDEVGIGIYNPSGSFPSASGEVISVFGAMLEEQSYATSYIPTNGSTVTRNAETCNGAGDAATFNDSEGVLMAEISALADDGTSRRISISDGGISNRVSIEIDETADRLRLFIDSNSLQVNNIGLTNFTKICGKYKANDYSLWVNGFELATLTTSSNVPSGLDRLNFDGGNLGNDFYGNTKQLQYYNSALTDSELEKLTSWTSFSDMANGQQYSII